MTMITEDYVSFEVAKLLKEKGFNGECRTVYKSNGCIHDNVRYEGKWLTNSLLFPSEYSAPTHQMAMQWLREKYKLFLGVGFGNDDKGEFLYMVDIYDLTIEAIEGKYKPIVEADDYLTVNPKTPAEAIEEALKYLLKKSDLI